MHQISRNFALASTLALAVLAGCADSNTNTLPNIQEVVVTPSTVNLLQGDRATLVANVAANNNAATTVTWQSADTRVATVDAQGVVTAVAPGTAVITATSTVDQTRRGSATVIVQPRPTPQVRGITLAPTSTTVRVGQTTIVTASVQADQGAVTTLTATSSNPAVATVSVTGSNITVTGVAPGTTIITAASTANPGVTQTAVVTVTAAPTPQVTGITVAPQQLPLTVGSTANITAVVQGEAGANTAVNFSSNNPAVATVTTGGTTGGQVRGVSPGTAIITVSSVANPQIAQLVTVTVSAVTTGVTGLQVTPGAVTTTQFGSPSIITANVQGTNANRGVTFTQSAGSNAFFSVTQNGTTLTITPIAPGSGSITVASAADPSVTQTIPVVVQAIRPAQVSIAQVTDPTTGQAVDLSRVAGNIITTLNINAGDQRVNAVSLFLECGTVRTLLGQQQINGSAAAGTVTFNTNTAGFNAATGTPTFANGPCTLVGELSVTNPDGTTGTATAARTALTLNNASFISGSVRPTGPTSIANDTTGINNGLSYSSGDVVVTILPVTFSGGPLSSVTYNYVSATGNVQLTRTVSANAQGAFVDTIRANSFAGQLGVDYVTQVLVGSSAADTVRLASATTAAGNNFALPAPTAANPTPNVLGTVRLDTQAPQGGAFNFLVGGRQNRFINSTFSFQSGMTAANGGANASDIPGVGGVTYRYFVGPAGTTACGAGTAPGTSPGPNLSTTGLTEVTTGAGLAGTLTNSAYCLKIIVTDELGNQRPIAAGTFGVENTAPVLTVNNTSTLNATSDTSNRISAANTPATSTARTLQVTVTDDTSGFAPTSATATVRRVSRQFSAILGANYTQDTTVILRVNNAADASFGSLTYPGGGNVITYTTPATTGEYSVTIVATDAAGNTTSTASRTFVYDLTQPTNQETTAPVSFTFTPSATSVATVGYTDNLDLAFIMARTLYTAGSQQTFTTLAGTQSQANGVNGISFRNDSVAVGGGANIDFSLSGIAQATVSAPLTNFFRSLQTVNNGGQQQLSGAGNYLVSENATNPSGVQGVGRDVAGNVNLGFTDAIPGINIDAPGNAPFTAIIGGTRQSTFSTFFIDIVANPTLCAGDVPAAVTAGNPCLPGDVTSTPLSATIAGPIATTTAPFTAVRFYYVDQMTRNGNTTSDLVFIGSASSVSAGIDASGNRTITYSGATFDPPATFTGRTMQIVAVGHNAAGDAILTAVTSAGTTAAVTTR